MPTNKRYTSPKPIPSRESFVVNFANVSIPEVNPAQLRFSPNDWVMYGDNNGFPDYLMKSVKKSPRHSRLIQLRENLIKGGGLSYSENVGFLLDNLDAEGGTIKELVRELATDLSILETFAVVVRYARNGKTIAAIDYIDSSKIRPSKQFELDEDGFPTDKVLGYWYSADWSNVQQNPPVFIERFNPWKKGRASKQLYFYHKRANGQPFLPEVSYVSCLNLVELDWELGKYALSSALNKFTSSGILSVKAVMTDEQKVRFKRDIDRQFTGSDAADSVMVSISETDDVIKFTPMQGADVTPWLKALSDMAEAGICTAHGAEPVLSGIRSQGSTLGSDGKLLKNAQEHYQNTVIIHFQEPILDFFQRVFKFVGVTEYDLAFIPKNLVSEDVPDWFLQDYIKPEVLAAKYGFQDEDLITVEAPETAPDATSPEIPSNPYPADAA